MVLIKNHPLFKVVFLFVKQIVLLSVSMKLLVEFLSRNQSNKLERMRVRQREVMRNRKIMWEREKLT